MQTSTTSTTDRQARLTRWLADAMNVRRLGSLAVLLVATGGFLWPEGRVALAGLGVVALAALRLLATARLAPAPVPARARRPK